jgi:hypothetical protein
MQQHDEFINGQITASNDDLSSANSTTNKDKMQLSRVSQISESSI